ncbi:MAG: hypothetical protein C0392_13400 [Syntrophus sp. (in: bacteria)]|nr:hypothetical protein [Syntrophus sp. (in: bacteria)]
MSIPKCLAIEFDDGSRKEIPFERLGKTIQENLSTLGLCPTPSSVGSSKSYILFRWQNGWQEILGVEKDRLDPFRYYVIERVEEIGRMSFDMGDDYPLLFVVRRLPSEVESVLMIDGAGAKSCNLAEKTMVRFGDRTEHIFYDQGTAGCAFEDNGEAHSWVSMLVEGAKKDIEKQQLNAMQILSMTPEEKVCLYREISLSLGIRAMEKQDDVNGFIEMLLLKTIS